MGLSAGFDAPSSGDAPTRIWKWNGSDTSQFGANVVPPTTGSTALSVIDGGSIGNLLSLELTGFSGRAMYPFPVPDLPQRYMLRWHLVQDTSNTTLTWALLSNLLSGAAYRGIELYRQCQGPNGSIAQHEGVAFSPIDTDSGGVITSTRMGTFQVGNLEEVLVEARVPTSIGDGPASPWLIAHLSTRNDLGADAHGYSSVAGLTAGFDAAWEDMDVPGLGIGTSRSTAGTGSILLKDIEVWTHPADEEPTFWFVGGGFEGID